jgi:hypothetical protein
MDVQFMTNEENQDGAQRRKNEASRMIPFVLRAKHYMSNASAEDRPDDAEHDCPKESHVHVHHRF